MSEIGDLYQEVILDHSRSPRNRGAIEGADRVAEGDNPLCGDRLKVFLKLDGDTIEDVRFEGQGCAISQASASVMAEQVRGRTLADVEPLFDTFHELVTGHHEGDPTELGTIAVFSGVSKYPARVKCAVLAWHTLKAAAAGTDTKVTTED